ncbi:MAG: protein tyrosine phosphatase (PTP) superfamily phosphohydrolase (DUF442 family) [Candidatus Paceibacteria bacterium]|jgi:protein tyrosine phosphatase (PTP) superfamily phosphohydrolase (DUF442 family)
MRKSLPKIALLTALLTALVAACVSSDQQAPSAPAQLLAVEDAYDLAGQLDLPAVPPGEFPELHNVFHLSDTIISGSEPQGSLAFAALQDMGVKTVISVDGKVPNIELAAAHGMRYVHIPIRYKGIEDDDLLALSKSFRELESPFYVHCFHGRHRGPAASAVGRVALDGASRERAVAEMRQWSGTSKKYSGLYRDIATKVMPSHDQSQAFVWDFPSAKPMVGFRQAMVEIPRLYDNLDLLADGDFELDAAHPDLDALNEARNLRDVLTQTCELDEVANKPADFQAWMNESREFSESLVRALEATRPGHIQLGARELALESLDSIADRCSKCHKAYRN